MEKNFLSKPASILLLQLILFFANCGSSTGEFGWTVTRAEIDDPLFHVTNTNTDFTMARENVTFEIEDTIHYIYILPPVKMNFLSFLDFSGPSEYMVALDKESLGFVEVDLKRKKIEQGNNLLRGSFSGLEPGNYRIKIVYDQEVVDSLDFKVLPKESYYSALDETGSLESETDEIVKYSR